MSEVSKMSSLPSSEAVLTHLYDKDGNSARIVDQAPSALEYSKTPFRVGNIAILDRPVPYDKPRVLVVNGELRVDELAMLRRYTPFVETQLAKPVTEKEDLPIPSELRRQYGDRVHMSKQKILGRLGIDTTAGSIMFELSNLLERINPEFATHEPTSTSITFGLLATGAVHILMHNFEQRKRDKIIHRASSGIVQHMSDPESGAITFVSKNITGSFDFAAAQALLGERDKNIVDYNYISINTLADPSNPNKGLHFSPGNYLYFHSESNGTVNFRVNPASLIKKLLTSTTDPTRLWHGGFNDIAVVLSNEQLQLQEATDRYDHERKIGTLTKTQLPDKLAALNTSIEDVKKDILVASLNLVDNFNNHMDLVHEEARQARASEIMLQVANGYKAENGTYDPQINAIFGLAARALAKVDITQEDSDKVAADIGSYLQSIAAEHNASDPTEMPRLYQGLINNFGKQLATLASWEDVVGVYFKDIVPLDLPGSGQCA